MHISVLLEEAIEALNIEDGKVYVDATLGYGGHSGEILKKNKKGLASVILAPIRITELVLYILT